MPFSEQEMADLAERISARQIHEVPPRPGIFSKNTLIPLGLVVVMIGGTWGVAVAFTSFQATVTRLREVQDADRIHVHEIETKAQKTCWTIEDQREWARQMHDENPPIKVPNPREIIQQRIGP